MWWVAERVGFASSQGPNLIVCPIQLTILTYNVQYVLHLSGRGEL